MSIWEMGSAGTFRTRLNWRPAEGASHRGMLHSRFGLLRAGTMTFQGGKQDGETVPVGKLTPGQVVVLNFGHVKVQTDCLVGVAPGLLGVANVGSPGLLPRGYEGELYITVQAIKAVALDELDSHATVAAFI